VGTVAVVDYGVGNLHSVRHALELVGGDVVVTTRPDDLRDAERIVLPGVGAFGECARRLRDSGFVEPLAHEVRGRGKPLLGICVGMQLLAREGHEMGVHAGLDWVGGVVRRLDVDDAGLKVPHVGWNDVEPETDSPLFKGFRRDSTFYFTHSYHLVLDDTSALAASCDYGVRFTAAVLAGNVVATQFHPEKSQETGLKLLENFLAWAP
jgi:imidazole glycerol-phosphate synthase subunit HisH